MAKRRPDINPNQFAWPIEPPAVYGSEGSYVDLGERAEHLIEALSAIGLRNQRLGFDTASNAKHYNRPIRERYQGALPAVQMGARDNEGVFLDEAKEGLWRATGYAALRETKPRLASRREIDSGARKMWRDFEATYGHTTHRKARNRYKGLLKRTIDRVSRFDVAEAA